MAYIARVISSNVRFSSPVLVFLLFQLHSVLCHLPQFTAIEREDDLQIGESMGKKYQIGGMDEGHHEEAARSMHNGHHGEQAMGYGKKQHSLEKDRLDRAKAGHQLHHHGSHHKEAGQVVGHVDSKQRKNHDKILKHTWDRGGGFVKKWHWNKGGHLEEERFDAEKKHKEHHGKHHHKEAGQKSKGKKAIEKHHKEAHKKEHSKMNEGREKKLSSGQVKESSHQVKGGKRQSHLEHDDLDKYSHLDNHGDEFGHVGGFMKPFSSTGKYLKSRLLSDGFGENVLATDRQFSKDESIPFRADFSKKTATIEQILPKNWRYGHIFGHGLNFLLPYSEY